MPSEGRFHLWHGSVVLKTSDPSVVGRSRTLEIPDSSRVNAHWKVATPDLGSKNGVRHNTTADIGGTDEGDGEHCVDRKAPRLFGLNHTQKVGQIQSYPSKKWSFSATSCPYSRLICSGSSTWLSISSVIVLLMLHFTLSLAGAPFSTLMRRPMANLPSSSAESL